MRNIKIFCSVLASAMILSVFSTGVYAGSYIADEAGLKDVKIDSAAFPDKTFREYVSKEYDTDKDGTLSVSEFSYVREMDVSGKGISDLKGIEYFQGLFTLKCNNNSLQTLDITLNFNLQCLDCSDNSISSLEIATIPLLRRAYPTGNKSESNGVLTYTAYYGPKDYSDDGNIYITFDSSTTITINPNAGWTMGARGWWFRKMDGTYLHNCGKQVGGEWFYFDKDGFLVQDKWVQTGGRWFYFEGDSMVASYWMMKDGKWYYFSGKDWKESGTQTDCGMQTGLQYIYTNGWKLYYFNEDGAMHKGWKCIDNKWYYFGSNGIIVTGWQKISGKWYYLMPADNGNIDIQKNGYMMTGWCNINNNWYYFKNSGEMATGWEKIGGKWYLFNKDNGAMITGWSMVNGEWYYLKDSGEMATGWFLINGKWYHTNSSGAMDTEWVKIDGKIYYFSPEYGYMYQGGDYFILGGFFTFDSDGVCQNPPEYLM